jgi:hypothetical protein
MIERVSLPSLRLGQSLATLAVLLAAANAQDVGHRGPSLAGAGPTVGEPTVTESKPQCKVWFVDGAWWGVLWSASAGAFHLQRLDPVAQVWSDRGVLVDARPDSHCDALWNGRKLYVVSHEFSRGPGSPGDPIQLARFSYAHGEFTLDAGFPVTIGDAASESVTLEQDSTGRLWAVWKQALRVTYAHSLGDDASWSAPAVLPGCTSDFTSDDLCAVVRFGPRIGVMWNDDVLDAFFFEVHEDGAPPTSWEPVETALAGESDDHIHLAADARGRVLAVVKTDSDSIELLVREAGAWSRHTVASGADGLTRPTMVLDDVAQRVHVFATVAGAIHEKSAPLDTLVFAPGSGTVIVRDSAGGLNNATSTKQNVDEQGGLLVLASNSSEAGHYWHHAVAGSSEGSGLVYATPLPGVAGLASTFAVSGATPGVLVTFYVSARTGTRSLPRAACPSGIRTNLGLPLWLMRSVRADAAGNAELVMLVPPGAAGATFFFQAVEGASCRASNRVTLGF